MWVLVVVYLKLPKKLEEGRLKNQRGDIVVLLQSIGGVALGVAATMLVVSQRVVYGRRKRGKKEKG